MAVCFLPLPSNGKKAVEQAGAVHMGALPRVHEKCRKVGLAWWNRPVIPGGRRMQVQAVWIKGLALYEK
jgi:hypothetical protein